MEHAPLIQAAVEALNESEPFNSRQFDRLVQQMDQGQFAQTVNGLFEWVKTGVINKREFISFMERLYSGEWKK